MLSDVISFICLFVGYQWGSLPCSKASVLFRFVAMAGFGCSFRASAGQFGLGSWHPGVGPGRLLKYLVFNAFSKKINPM